MPINTDDYLNGVLSEELGIPFQAAFIIRMYFQFKYVSLYPPEVGRNIAEIIRVMQGLLYEEPSALGAPASWQPSLPGSLKYLKLARKI